MSGLPLRTRLVAGFSAAMLVLLAAAGAFVYWRVEYALDRGLDTDLDRATATIAPLVGGGGRVEDRTDAAATGATWQVLDADGAVLDAGGGADSTPLVGRSVLARGEGVVELGDLLPVADRPYRLHVSDLPDGRHLLVGVRRDHRDEALRELLLQLTLAGLAALVVASVVGDLLARAALRPVERYRRRAEEIAGGASGLRLDVPADRGDEITRLGDTLNEMLAALERSLDHERRFVNDASHELRTPLALLQSRIQLARRRSRDVAEHEAVLDELAVDVRRLVDLAGQLLDLGTPLAGGACDATAVVTGLASRRGFPVELPAEPLPVAVDARSLERVVTNLVDNAVLHGSPPVLVSLSDHAGYVLLRVTDGGAGMDADLLHRATGRFTRAPEARARPGSGLGLALVEQLVRGAGGELRVCHAGVHTSYGVTTGVPCDHGSAMTVSVLLPAGTLTA